MMTNDWSDLREERIRIEDALRRESEEVENMMVEEEIHCDRPEGDGYCPREVRWWVKVTHWAGPYYCCDEDLGMTADVVLDTAAGEGAPDTDLVVIVQAANQSPNSFTIVKEYFEAHPSDVVSLGRVVAYAGKVLGQRAGNRTRWALDRGLKEAWLQRVPGRFIGYQWAGR